MQSFIMFHFGPSSKHIKHDSHMQVSFSWTGFCLSTRNAVSVCCCGGQDAYISKTPIEGDGVNRHF